MQNGKSVQLLDDTSETMKQLQQLGFEVVTAVSQFWWDASR